MNLWTIIRESATAQNRHMLYQELNFYIGPDIGLDIMRPNQALTNLTACPLLDLDNLLQTEKPDDVMVQGDKITVMTVALACFYHHFPLGHVEAGLHTWDMQYPFPEGADRVNAGRIVNVLYEYFA
jgi:UDP-N-acetylglucosamine 2-epimerase (non-hydrolysing)